MAILNFPPLKWEFTQSTKIEAFPARLGDNYSVCGTVPESDRITWNVNFPNLTYQESDELVQLFSSLQGSGLFQWSPDPVIPIRDYVCDSWGVTKQGVDVVQVSAVFVEIR